MSSSFCVGNAGWIDGWWFTQFFKKNHLYSREGSWKTFCLMQIIRVFEGCYILISRALGHIGGGLKQVRGDTYSIWKTCAT